jgi:DNA-directed RNA polymerase subunit M/transcription elongation factor TFIIS
MDFCDLCCNRLIFVEIDNTIKHKCVSCKNVQNTKNNTLYINSNKDEKYKVFSHILKQIPFNAASYKIKKECINTLCKSPIISLFRDNDTEECYYSCHCGTIWQLKNE